MMVERILAAECRLPLPNPIRLGPVEIKTRDFVAVRIETKDGKHGDALGYPRGFGLLDAVKVASPFVLGTEVSRRRSTVEGFLQSFVNNRPGFIKAASLIDIALWDLAAKSTGLPLHELLGGYRGTIPVMVVTGYFLDQRSIDDICDEVRRRMDEGHERIKIMISGSDAGFDERLVAAATEVAGNRICVDAHWAWSNIPQALDTCRRLAQFPINFIEDPFGPHQVMLTGTLQEQVGIPFAVGEDLPDLQTICAAIAPVSFYRLDATTCGGITASIAATEHAGMFGKEVLPHVFMPVHAQLAGALPAIGSVEFIPSDTHACPMYDLLLDKPRIDSGVLTIDTRPGAGFRLDWEAVGKFATSVLTLED